MLTSVTMAQRQNQPANLYPSHTKGPGNRRQQLHRQDTAWDQCPAVLRAQGTATGKVLSSTRPDTRGAHSPCPSARGHSPDGRPHEKTTISLQPSHGHPLLP